MNPTKCVALIELLKSGVSPYDIKYKNELLDEILSLLTTLLQLQNSPVVMSEEGTFSIITQFAIQNKDMGISKTQLLDLAKALRTQTLLNLAKVVEEIPRAIKEWSEQDIEINNTDDVRRNQLRLSTALTKLLKGVNNVSLPKR